MCKSFFFEGADELLLDGDAAMPANRAEPYANVGSAAGLRLSMRLAVLAAR